MTNKVRKTVKLTCYKALVDFQYSARETHPIITFNNFDGEIDDDFLRGWLESERDHYELEIQFDLIDCVDNLIQGHRYGRKPGCVLDPEARPVLEHLYWQLKECMKLIEQVTFDEE